MGGAPCSGCPARSTTNRGCSRLDGTAAHRPESSARRSNCPPGALQLRGSIAARYAFSQVTSLAYAAAAPTFAGVQLKRVLQQEGYYYAQGPVTSAVLEGEVGGVVRIAVEGRVANFWSIDSDY